MDKNLLEATMKLHGDTGTSLSQYLGMARSTFSSKINETNGAEFNKREIEKIGSRYNLGATEIYEIFFNPSVSKLDTNREVR